MVPAFRTEILANGLTLEFFDESNRYFGDYWRIRLEARCTVSVRSALADDPDLPQALQLLGESILYSRSLEKMGVPGDNAVSVRQALISAFLEGASPYLSSPSFPARLVRQKIAEQKKVARSFFVPE